MSGVIQVVQRLAPGGLEILTTSLASNLSNEDYILSLEGESTQLVKNWAHLNSLQAKILSCQKADGLQLNLIGKIFSHFMRVKPKAVLTHHIGPLLYAGFAARICGVKTIIHVEHDGWHLKSPRRAFIEKVALTFIQPKVVAVSSQVAGELNRIGLYDVTIIRNGVDIDKFSPRDQEAARLKYNLPQDVALFGASGRLEHVKGHDLLLRAFANIHFDCHLAIAGNGSEMDNLKALAKQLNIEQRVHFLGHIDDTAQFYASLDVFVLPSRNEGLPLSLLEAQSCGIRSIAFDVGGVCEGLCAETGELVLENDTEELALAMARVHKRATYITPRDFIIDNFNLKNTISGYRSLIEGAK